MASPFSIFRRNQKVMLAILGVAVMIAFVMSDMLQSLGGYGNGRGAAPAYVEMFGRQYSEAEVGQIVANRQSLREFMRLLVVRMAEADRQQTLASDPFVQLMVNSRLNLIEEVLFARFNQGAEQAAVETLLLARHAEQAGMIVSDDAINDFLESFVTDNKLRAADIRGVIDELRQQRNMDQTRIFAALRTELLASRYREQFLANLRSPTPAQLWDYFRRVNRFATVELLPVQAADFVDQVREPTEAELQGFYEQHKDRVPEPNSPDPGFKRPQRVALEYFKAEFEHYVTQADVKEDEIKKYYEDNKEEQFVKTQLPPTADESRSGETGTPATEKPGGPAAPAGTKPSAEPAGEEPPPADPPTPESSPPNGQATEPGAAATEQPATPAPAADKPAVEEPKTEESKTEKPETGAPGGGPGLAGRWDAAKGLAQVLLMSLQEAENEEATAAAPAADPPAAAEPAAPAEPAASPAPQPGPAKTETDKAAVEASGSATTEPKPAAATNEPALPPKEYVPLDLVREEIRRTLARNKAREAMGQVMDDVQVQMQQYDVKRVNFNQRNKGGEPYEQKNPFPLAELASAKGLGAYRTRLLTPVELSKEKVGTSTQTIRGLNAAPIPVWRLAFASRTDLYVTMLSTDTDGNMYLSWKTREVPAAVPPLVEIRARVIGEWKLVQARELARKKAEEFAARARSSKQLLVEEFGKTEGRQVLEPTQFTWLTRGSVPNDAEGQLMLSEIEGVEGASGELRETIFSLAPSEVGVARSLNLNTVYVVRVKRFAPLAADLQERFYTENPRNYLAAGQADVIQVARTWLADLEKQAGLTWLRESLVAQQEQ
jgi:hypothetical protein